MTITLDLPADVAEACVAEAEARGMPVDELVRNLLLSLKPLPAACELSPQEWMKEFRTWVASHAENAVVLPDQAMERESIYADHGR